MLYDSNLYNAAAFNYISKKLKQKSSHMKREKWDLVKTQLQSRVRGPMVNAMETQDLDQMADVALSKSEQLERELK